MLGQRNFYTNFYDFSALSVTFVLISFNSWAFLPEVTKAGDWLVWKVEHSKEGGREGEFREKEIEEKEGKKLILNF